MKVSYIKSLDGLRGIAVLLVILFHFSMVPFVSFGFEVGWVGVQLFFVLSGFLITRILIADKENSFSSYVKKFYWRRSLRIFPLYFLYVGILYVLYLLINQPDNFPVVAPFLLTYTFNFYILSPDWEVSRFFSHLWSLSVEEQFYLVWPFVLYFLSVKNFRRFTVALIFLVPIVRLLMGLVLMNKFQSEEMTGIAVYYITFSHFDAFAIGGLISLINEETKQKLLKYYWFVVSFVPLAGIVNLYNYTGDVNWGNITSMGYLIHSLENYQHVWSYTLINILCAFIILKLTQKESKWLCWHPLVYLGKISYGMYVYHMLVIGVFASVLGKLIINDFISLLVILITVIIISTGSFYLFEKRFLVLKNSSVKKKTLT